MTPEQARAEFARRMKGRKINSYQPYKWQQEFHAAGASNPERLLMAANRCGKTFSAASEVTYHLTGEYPEWWEGKRFDEPVLVWAGSVSNEASRDIVQKELMGPADALGTGTIPGEHIIGKPRMKQAGIPNVMDSVSVRHASGGNSEVVFKSYEQGWRKWQGTAPEVVWMDEEPRDNKDEGSIYSEAITRLITSHGIMLVTFTPLLGMTKLVRHFMNPETDGVYLKTATWDMAEHLDQDEKERIVNSYPEHERETRTKGIPMMGEGKVFTVSESDVKIDPIKIPDHWARICGIDFGSAGSGGHPSAGAWLAWDRDSDIIYIYDCYKIKAETTAYLAEAIKAKGQWIPCSWPHDGLKTESSNGVPMWQHYKRHGVKMLGLSARYSNDKGGGQPVEPIVDDVLERFKTGRLKIFSTCEPLLEEFRNYHREDGRIVAKMDDALKAMFYAIMMKRYATTRSLSMPAKRTVKPIVRGW